eukprot:7549373-Lingulodinium_polyedra.AAC.1
MYGLKSVRRSFQAYGVFATDELGLERVNNVWRLWRRGQREVYTVAYAGDLLIAGASRSSQAGCRGDIV